VPGLPCGRVRGRAISNDFEDRRFEPKAHPSFTESAAQCGERARIFDNRLNVPVVRKMLEIYFEQSHKIRFIDGFCR
jgi:hypothetical protein